VSDLFAAYAQFYDALYETKDYDAEVAYLEEAFRRYGSFPVRTVLDVGCGTGGHALPLAGRGYAMTGVDRSSPMIELARQKLSQQALHVDFHVADARSFTLGRTFDAVVCMFAALGYLTENEDVSAALQTIAAHLRPGGLFIFDVWNGLAVLRELPETRLKVVETNGVRVFRFVEPHLDAARQVCTDDYQLLAIQGDKVVAQIQESHTMRYFFPQELRHYLGTAGFDLCSLERFPPGGGAVDEHAWNMIAVARLR
jgi:SAM-dependent methyltransferase